MIPMGFALLIEGDQMLVVDEREHSLSDHHPDSATKPNFSGKNKRAETERKTGEKVFKMFKKEVENICLLFLINPMISKTQPNQNAKLKNLRKQNSNQSECDVLYSDKFCHYLATERT